MTIIKKIKKRMKKIKKRIEQLTGTHIYRVLPFGINIIHDIYKAFPMYRVDIIFDVGANVGQSSKIYLAELPGSHIYCFEPVSDTFRQLQDNLKGNERVDFYQLALGSSKSKGKMVLQGNSRMFFLLDQSNQTQINNNLTTESIDIVTLDEFCHTNKINQISYLKIDTEGGDLEVLKGSVNMLTEQKIDFLEVEAGMNPSNKWHIPFETLKEFLESHRYFLFGIYEQVKEWPTREPHLRRTNLLFISDNMIEMSRNFG